jgi:tryptophanyl-tRNA synthetase
MRHVSAQPRSGKQRVLSGAQPTADSYHLGNYFGAFRQWVALQDEFDAFYFIPDLHAITTDYDPALLRERTYAAAAQLLAAGVDPERSALFVQSHVPEHAQLAWVLGGITGYGEAGRMTQFKDKTAKGGADKASVGLFTYPVLMAADILIYDSDVVPVGKDQKQHIEITRDLAVKVNEQYGQVFKLPEARIRETTETVPGIDGQKMSKSYGNTIDIFGEEKETRKRVMSIVTDSQPVEAPKDAASSTIVQLYSLVATAAELSEMREKFQQGGTGYGDFKKQLFGKLW